MSEACGVYSQDFHLLNEISLQKRQVSKLFLYRLRMETVFGGMLLSIGMRNKLLITIYFFPLKCVQSG